MKKIFFMFLSLLVIGLLAACGTTNENQEEADTDEVEESEVDEVEEDSDPAEEDDVDQDETEGNENVDDATEPEETTPPEENTDDADVDTVKEEVTFIGMADPHTIEVETEDETFALQILDFMDDDWGSIEMGTPMTIEYYKNEHDQLILTDYTVE